MTDRSALRKIADVPNLQIPYDGGRARFTLTAGNQNADVRVVAYLSYYDEKGKLIKDAKVTNPLTIEIRDERLAVTARVYDPSTNSWEPSLSIDASPAANMEFSFQKKNSQ